MINPPHGADFLYVYGWDMGIYMDGGLYEFFLY